MILLLLEYIAVFEFTNNKGIAVDGKSFNVLLMEKVKLSRANFAGMVGGISYMPTMSFDIVLKSDYDVPIIGISFFEGLAYAEASYINEKKEKRARIWILFDEILIQEKFPNYTTPSFNDEFSLDYMMNFFDLNVYIYGINPTSKTNNYGLQVFDENGKFVFGSDYPPMKLGIKGNINDGRHIIFLNHFFDLSWIHYNYKDLYTILENHCTPIMTTYHDGKMVDFQSHFQKKPSHSDVFRNNFRGDFYENLISESPRYAYIGYY